MRGILALWCLLACADGQKAERIAISQPKVSDGLLILGSAPAKAYAMNAGDTLKELAASTVPSSVYQGAARLAQQLRSSRITLACIRYFGGEKTYVLLLEVDCDHPGDGVDGVSMAALSGNGYEIGNSFPFATDEHYLEVMPSRRASQNRTSDSASKGRPEE